MCTDWLRPLTELANCVIVPLAKCVGKWGYDLLCYHKVIKELESVASTLKEVHADIEGTVDAAKAQGQVVNKGRIDVHIWLRQAAALIKDLEAIKRDSKVESDDRLFLMMCHCTRCCNCGEAQKKMKAASALMTEAKAFILPLVGQAQSGGYSETHERYWAKVRSFSTPDIPMIIDDQLEMEDAIVPITEAKTFNLTLGWQAQSGGHSKTNKRYWAEVLVRSFSTPDIRMIIDDQLEMEENLLA